MKRTSFAFTFLLVSLSVLTLPSCETSKAGTSARMLKFNLEKGKGYDYEMNTSFDQEIMGQKMSMDMAAYYTMDISEVEGDTKTVTMTYDRFKINTSVGGMNIDLDSDKPMTVDPGDDEKTKGLAMINNLFANIKGKQFKMKINAEGKILEVTGMKEMAESIVQGMDLGENSEEEKSKMMEQFTKQFNDEEMKGTFERILYIFPNKEVKVGDSWEKNTVAKTADMPMKYNSTYTVKEIEGDMVTLEEKSKILSSDDKAKMDGKVDGTLIVDSRSGLLVNADHKLKIKVTGEGGMSFEMNGVTKVKGKAN